MKRKIDTRDSLRVVMSNEIITARNISTMGIRARKLVYIAIAQCKMTDKEFFEYTITVPEFSKMMGVKPSNIYQEGLDITAQAMRTLIETRETGKGAVQKPLFDECRYKEKEGIIIFEIHPKMAPYLLDLNRDFTKTLLRDLLRMKSQYSMDIWNLMQMKMKSLKPGIHDVIKFELSLEEIRKVTGTEKKFERTSDIKRYVLDIAIKDIRESCGVIIEYENIKQGRFVIGFRFKAKSEYYMEFNNEVLTPEQEATRTRLRAKERQLQA